MKRLAVPANSPRLYVALFEGNEFYGYKLPHTTPFCSKSRITDLGFYGYIGTDRSGRLWLPTGSLATGEDSISSYAPNCGRHGMKLYPPPPGLIPQAIAFGRDGTKYGLMLPTTYSGSSLVAVYPSGATRPTAELTDPRLNGFDAEGIGIDSAGKVYVSCCANSQSRNFVIVFESGQGSQQHGKRIFLSQLKHPSSLTFDGSNDLIIPDMGTSSLKVYAPPYSGNPSKYPLQGMPFQCSLSSREHLLACADYDNQDVDVYTYPSISYQYSLTYYNPSRIFPIGVAFAPS